MQVFRVFVILAHMDPFEFCAISVTELPLHIRGTHLSWCCINIVAVDLSLQRFRFIRVLVARIAPENISCQLLVQILR